MSESYNGPFWNYQTNSWQVKISRAYYSCRRINKRQFMAIKIAVEKISKDQHIKKQEDNKCPQNT